jgi:hypothetical protein
MGRYEEPKGTMAADRQTQVGKFATRKKDWWYSNEGGTGKREEKWWGRMGSRCLLSKPQERGKA